MRIMVLGGDGYLGWPTALHLSNSGHDVAILDDGSRRRIDQQLGTSSLVPICSIQRRLDSWHRDAGVWLPYYHTDMEDYDEVVFALREFAPDTVVHLAEQRSAPYSMMGLAQALYTQQNNVMGTLVLIHAVAEVDPSIHIVKLGTMGEYGTPNIDIEEGWLDVEHNGRRDRVLYPKRAGSWYHLSKVHDSHNLEFACRAWGLRVTDLNQGVVYGHETWQTAASPQLATRFDYDDVYGTVLNRFAVQAALDMPLTVYGSGRQRRGFINLRDAVRCIELACKNPPAAGDFTVYNQMTETFSVAELAQQVARVAPNVGVNMMMDNPRVESEDHYYNVTHTTLPELGLKPTMLDDDEILRLIDVATQHADRIDTTRLKEPRVQWRRQSSGN